MLQSNLFHSINQFSRHFTKALNEVLVPLGIYSSQWSIIYSLHKHGSITQIELANYLGIEPPSMTRALNRLEKSGYIKKVSGKDKREKLILLTEKAEEHYPVWLSAIKSFEEQKLSGISTKDMEDAYKVIQKLNKNL
jgi:MarR family transcriptional regulator, transcriptional regulator for hemolysin